MRVSVQGQVAVASGDCLLALVQGFVGLGVHGTVHDTKVARGRTVLAADGNICTRLASRAERLVVQVYLTMKAVLGEVEPRVVWEAVAFATARASGADSHSPISQV